MKKRTAFFVVLALNVALCAEAAENSSSKYCDLSKLPSDVSDFVVRDGSCAVVPEIAKGRGQDKLRAQWTCASLETDRAALRAKYRDKPQVLAMLKNRRCVLKLGFTGLDQYL